jgi:hypothetical protein
MLVRRAQIGKWVETVNGGDDCVRLEEWRWETVRKSKMGWESRKDVTSQTQARVNGQWMG